MRQRAITANRTNFSRTCCAIAAGVSALFFATVARADSPGPFDVDPSHWVPYNLYKEGATDGLPKPAAPKIDLPDASAAVPGASTTSTSPDSSAAPAAATTASAAPAIAAPTRPIDIPVMPGMNKGYSISVQSTADNDRLPVAQISNMDAPDKAPDIHLKEQNWQKAAEVARIPASTDGDDDDEKKPIDIRLSFLPNSSIVPAPSDTKPQTHGRRQPGVPKVADSTPEAPKKSPQELAACAAMDAYKKHQLQAIQSDRQTLKDLQAAIAQLGLQKQLSFMSNAEGSLSASASEKTDSPATAQP